MLGVSSSLVVLPYRDLPDLICASVTPCSPVRILSTCSEERTRGEGEEVVGGGAAAVRREEEWSWRECTRLMALVQVSL